MFVIIVLLKSPDTFAEKGINPLKVSFVIAPKLVFRINSS